MDKHLSRITPFILPIIVGLATPWCTFMYLMLAVKGSSYSEAMSAFITTYFFVATVTGLIPFIILSMILWVFAGRAKPSYAGLAVMCLCGLGSILLPMVNTYLSLWRHNLNQPIVAYLFIASYCTITMLLGVFIGWVIVRTRI